MDYSEFLFLSVFILIRKVFINYQMYWHKVVHNIFFFNIRRIFNHIHFFLVFCLPRDLLILLVLKTNLWFCSFSLLHICHLFRMSIWNPYLFINPYRYYVRVQLCFTFLTSYEYLDHYSSAFFFFSDTLVCIWGYTLPVNTHVNRPYFIIIIFSFVIDF